MAKTKKLGDLVNQTISTNAPLSGGANLTDVLNFSITKANTTTDGYVSAIDWNIFNNKEDALGFTPYNATNPDGYISGITSGMVTTALGFTPYDSANPDGYITSSALTSYVPYTGATADVDLGTHSLTASDLIIDHASGSGVAASITKGGNGEALTVVKSSGSGNVASFTGGNTFISTLTTPTINGVSGLLSFGSTDRVAINYPSLPTIYKLGVGGKIAVKGEIVIQDDSGSFSSYSTDGLIQSGGFNFNRYVGVNIYSSNTNPIKLSVNGTENFRMFNGGNILIQNGGTFTNAGFRLDVNGTARFQGNVSLTQTVTTETLVQTRSVTIVINGTTYKLLAA
jgi:hypothetical protein